MNSRDAYFNFLVSSVWPKARNILKYKIKLSTSRPKMSIKRKLTGVLKGYCLPAA
jgi:hypothetical protein